MATGTWRANLATGIVVLIGAVLAGLYHQRTMAEARARQDARYTATAQTRHARLLGQMAARQQLLQTVAAFFQASDHVSSGEFETFGQSVLESTDLTALCFTSTLDEDHLAATQAGVTDAPCREVDLLEPSRVVDHGPLIILSVFAATTDRTQQGFVSLVLTIDSIFLGDPARELDDYLVVNNYIQNTTTIYRFQSTAPVTLKESSSKNNHFELATFGSVQFLYLTVQRSVATASLPAALITVFLLILTLVTALYVRSLLLTRAVVLREVADRTAELAQFSYRTSHDLRGPLATIAGLCRAAQEDLTDGATEDVAHSLGRIAHHASRLDTLVGDLLDLTRADLQEHPAEPIDFQALLEAVHADLKDTHADHAVHTIADVRLDGPRMGQRTRIEQVLTNLISNSIKYARPDAEQPYVRTTVSEAGSALRISVSDNGLGIPEEHQERAFAMFERLHPEVSAAGSGLGLAIVQKHIEHLRGQITLSSGPSGTTFTITLPLRET